MRNLLKRALLACVQKQLQEKEFPRYYKIFIVLNKNKIPELQKEFENLDKKDIIARIQILFGKSFTALSQQLGKVS